MARQQQYCTFYLDGLFFGVEVEKVQEVIRFQEMTDIPRAPREVHGLINLRGQIVTAMDLRTRLELTEREQGVKPMNVVIRTVEGPMSLLVDEIADVLEVDEQIFERPPETIKGVARQLIRGIYKLEGCLLLILDTETAIRFGAVSSMSAEAK